MLRFRSAPDTNPSGPNPRQDASFRFYGLPADTLFWGFSKLRGDTSFQLVKTKMPILVKAFG
jgi:hypothetical protein